MSLWRGEPKNNFNASCITVCVCVNGVMHASVYQCDVFFVCLFKVW